MFWYSKIGTNLLSLIITLVLFFAFSFIKVNINFDNFNFRQNINKQSENTQNAVETEEVNYKNTSEESKQIQNFKYSWEIIIPKINLSAPISEGTTKEVMDKFVGHFVDSGVIKNNICLGAHNRGYPVNYFENIKNLQEGDLIYYKKDEYIKVFKIETVTVIKDTDWTYLENTEDNRITLITCVENEPDYRRCVQAVEFKEEK